jgi:hypothetical protein
MRLNAIMPASKTNDRGFIAPPPPLLELGAEELSSVTLADAEADNPLVVELQVIPKVNTTDEVSRATGSVTVWLPLFALVPAQLSSAPPPVAVQPVAFEDAQVRVVDCPAVMVVGDAEIVGVTAGHFQTTDVDGSTTGAPGAVQLIR